MSTKRHHSGAGEEPQMDAVLQKAFEADISPDDDIRLQELFEGFRNDLALHPHVQRRGRRAEGRPSRWIRHLALATGAGVVAFLLGLALFLGQGTPAWADVVERFRSVSFFSATLYLKEDALAQPEQIELWLAEGGRLRMRVGNQVVFATRGEVSRAFDVKERRQTEPDYRALELMEMLGDTTCFSLDSIIKTIPGSALVDATPKLNADAVVANDMMVFDVQSPSSPEWLRIWALRERVHLRKSTSDSGSKACLTFRTK